MYLLVNYHAVMSNYNSLYIYSVHIATSAIWALLFYGFAHVSNRADTIILKKECGIHSSKTITFPPIRRLQS